MFILGIIPARGGSAGIKDKPIYPLCGKPMIEYTIDAAANSDLDDWLVFSDKYRNYRTLDIPSPPELNTGEHGIAIRFIRYVVSEYEKRHNVDAVCLLQPTSPLRTAADINNALTLYRLQPKSLYSGYYMRIKQKDKIDSKEVKPHFQRNGAIFIMSRELIEEGRLWSGDVIEFEMPKSRSIDIDNMDDMFMAESIIKNGGSK